MDWLFGGIMKATARAGSSGWRTAVAVMVLVCSPAVTNAGESQPTIVTQPVGQFVVEGFQASFCVVAQGTSLTYQWKRNGAVLPGQIYSSLYHTARTSEVDDGSTYQVTVSNSAGSVVSQAATLQVSQARTMPLDTVVRSDTDEDGYDVLRVTIAELGIYRLGITGVDTDLYSENSWFGIRNSAGEAIGLGYQWSGAYDYESYVTLEPGIYLVYLSAYWDIGEYDAILSTVAAPEITSEPIDQTIIEGHPVTFQVAVASTAPATYAWNRDGVVIANQTQSSYRIDVVSEAMSGARFQVRVNGVVDSREATLNVTPAPALSLDVPTSSSYVAGDVDVFRLNIATLGDYQVVITDNTMTNYQISMFDLAGNLLKSGALNSATFANLAPGTYLVRVRDTNQTGGSYSLTVSTLAAPAITTQPVDIAMIEGHSAIFRVVAQSAAPLTYQWNRNGTSIPGAVQSTYPVGFATRVMDQDVFQVRVSAQVDSRQALLRVAEAPALPLSTPTTTNIVAGDVGVFRLSIPDRATYQLTLTNSTLTSSWISIHRLDGTTLLTGSYDSTLYATLDPGVYLARVTSSTAGGTYTITSTQLPLPLITTQPSDQTVTEGHAAVFSVVVQSAAPITYQWSLDGTIIPYATQDSYRVPLATRAMDQSRYQVRVSNLVDSRQAGLSVNQAPTLVIGTTTPSSVVAGDVDVFRVTVPSRQAYQLAITNSAVSNYQISVLALDGTLLMNGSYNTSVLMALEAGTYLIRVGYYNNVGSTYSLTMSPLAPPAITAQPQPRAITEGQYVNFSVTATSVPAISYQWNRDGTNLPGKTTRPISREALRRCPPP